MKSVALSKLGSVVAIIVNKAAKTDDNDIVPKSGYCQQLQHVIEGFVLNA